MDYKKVSENLLAMLLICAFSSPAMAEKIYRWVDKNGVVGFTDNLSGIPEKYLETVTPYTETQPGENAGLLQKTQPRQPVELDFPEDLDFNGHDQQWWKNRVLDLKTRKEALLKEKQRLQEEHATSYNIWLNPFAPGNQNIGKINNAINQGQLPNPNLFFGLPIPQPQITQSLDDLKNQISQVDDELNEIDHALNVDLSDEARKAGAPPGWLRD